MVHKYTLLEKDSLLGTRWKMDWKLFFLTLSLLTILHGSNSSPVVADDELLCEICHRLVHDMTGLISENATKAEIEGHLDDICNGLAGQQEKCRDMVHSSLPGILDTMVDKMNPENVCITLKVCPGLVEEVELPKEISNTVVSDVVEPKKVEPSNIILKEVREYGECSLCKLAVQSLGVAVSDKTDEQNIQDKLEMFCNGLPKDLSEHCGSFKATLLKELENGFDPVKVCRAIDRCGEESSKSLHIPALTCEACQDLLEGLAGQDGVRMCFSIPGICSYEQEEEFTNHIEQNIEPERQQVKETSQNEDKIKPDEETEKPVDDTLICEICKILVQELDNILEQNRSLAQINSTLRMLCDSLPGELAGICDEFEGKLIQALANGVNSSIACTYIKLCQGDQIVHEEQIKKIKELEPKIEEEEFDDEKEKLEAPKKQVVEKTIKANPVECELCKLVITAVDNYAKQNGTAKKLNDTLNEICEKIPTALKAFCQQYEPEVIDIIQNGLDPTTACQKIQLCDGSQEQKDWEMKKENIKANPIECEFCKLLITEVNKFITTNGSADKINETLLNICEQIPAAFQPLCKQYEAEIVTIVQNGLDPATACKLIRLCDASQKQKAVKLMKENNDEANPIECEFCKLLITEVNKYIQVNGSADKINETLLNICEQIPAAFQPLCKQYEEQIVLIVKNGLDPATACKLLRLCDATDIEIQYITESLKANPIECELCKLVITAVDNYVKQNVTGQKINDTLNAICDKIPAALKAFCQQYEPEVVDIIMNGLDPTTACQKIKLCDTNKNRSTVKKVPKPKAKANPVECELCKLVITAVDNYVKQNGSAKRLNDTLEEICDKIPAALKAFCQQYEPEVIDIIQNGLDPTTACQKIELCAAEKKKLIARQLPNVKSNPVECELCKLVITAVDNYVKQNGSAKRLNDTLEEICDKIPAALKAFCQQYEPEVIDIIQNGLDPATACQKIELCDSEKNKSTVKKTRKMKANPVECELCKLVVTAVDNYVKQNGTAKRLNDTLNEICEKIPAALKAFCQQYEPEIIDIIQNGLDPATACQKIELCDTTLLQIKDDSIECTFCKFMLTEVNKTINLNSTKQDINSTLFRLCDKYVPAVFPRRLCETMLPDIEHAFEYRFFDADIACGLVGLCKDNETLPSLKPIAQEIPKVTADAKCELCQFMVQLIDEKIKSGGSVEMINSTILNLCNSIPDDNLKQLCLASAPTIVNQIISGIDPETACVAVEMCPQQQSKPLAAIEEEEEPEAEPLIEEEEEYLPEIETKVNVKDDLVCDVCELVITLLDDELKKNQSEKALNETLYKLCDTLPDALKLLVSIDIQHIKCHTAAPDLVKVISAGFNATSACKMIGLCGNSSRIIDPVPHISCDLCHGIVEKISPMHYNQEKGDIKCAAFCSSHRRNRRSIKKPENFAMKIVGSKPFKKIAKLEKTWRCELCELIVDGLNDFLKDNKTDAEIVNYLQQVCAFLPSPYKEECNRTSAYIIQEMSHGADSKMLCKTLFKDTDDCKNDTMLIGALKFTNTVNKKEDKSEWECKTCKEILQYIADNVETDFESVKKFLDDVCGRLPEPTNKACSTFADTKAQTVIDKILNKILNPSMVCEMVKICPTNGHH